VGVSQVLAEQIAVQRLTIDRGSTGLQDTVNVLDLQVDGKPESFPSDF